ncbi:MAG: hypothetical protein A2X25_02840 [Chloroflexi bacterium GWB2_49_20]|nr:MAG: hypothetical protein A2X25_02840 [Chloroflexi bacterium GWB2_49_20]OGN78762.1 MAG: hypothetical protein A2X26_12940 [Chloroflexi bacterium GWC2_49_37]OGN85868.1 MAG: hypothetical protein A2X27_11745 [Chloroflexi bacterium GWD2_49_16]
MKKTVTALLIVAVVAIALSTAGLAYAQAPTPQAPVTGSGYGYGMNGNARMHSGIMGQNVVSGTQDGVLHDVMIAAFAEQLGISVEDLNARLDAGETVADVAFSKGLTVDEFRTLMTDARSQAIDQALLDGTLTQEQADRMNQRGGGQMMGAGAGRGARGAGQGQFSNPGCPYYDEVQP